MAAWASVTARGGADLSRDGASLHVRILVRALKRAYRTLYRSGLSLEEARRELQAQSAACPEAGLILQFLDATKRGIIR